MLNKFNSGALYDQTIANMTANTATTDPALISATNPNPRDPTPVNRNALHNAYGEDNGF